MVIVDMRIFKLVVIFRLSHNNFRARERLSTLYSLHFSQALIISCCIIQVQLISLFITERNYCVLDITFPKASWVVTTVPSSGSLGLQKILASRPQIPVVFPERPSVCDFFWHQVCHFNTNSPIPTGVLQFNSDTIWSYHRRLKLRTQSHKTAST